MYEFVPPLDKELIEKHYSHADLLSYYTGQTFKPGHWFSSPLREDKNPSACFYINNNGRPIFYDFAERRTYDCYSLVMALFDASFPEALAIIASDLRIRHSGNAKSVARNSQVVLPKQVYEAKPSVIYYSNSLPWNADTLAYWKEYRLSEELLNRFNVAPIHTLSLNGKLIRVWDNQNPIYRYSFGERRKFYSPLDSLRFIGHGGLQLSPSQLGHSNVLVITKSYKDVMCFAYHGVESLATASETSYLSDGQAEKLSSRYDMIYINGDNDETGLKFIEYHKNTYGFTPLLIDQKGIKDFADMQRYDFNSALSLIQNL